MRIGVSKAGVVTLYSGALDVGQGSNTILTQIAADAAGLPMSTIRLVTGDTDLTADAGKTSASRQTFVSGKATELAALELRKKLFAIANAPEGEYLDRAYKLAIEGNGKSAQIVIRRDGITHRVPLKQAVLAEGYFDPPTSP